MEHTTRESTLVEEDTTEAGFATPDDHSMAEQDSPAPSPPQPTFEGTDDHSKAEQDSPAPIPLQLTCEATYDHSKEAEDDVKAGLDVVGFKEEESGIKAVDRFKDEAKGHAVDMLVDQSDDIEQVKCSSGGITHNKGLDYKGKGIIVCEDEKHEDNDASLERVANSKGLYIENSYTMKGKVKIFQGNSSSHQGGKFDKRETEEKGSSEGDQGRSAFRKGNLVISKGMDKTEFQGKSHVELIGRFQIKLSLKVDTGSGPARTVIPRDARLPTKRPVKFTIAPLASMTEFRIFQGERPVASDNYYLGLVPYVASAGQYAVELVVTFNVDVYGNLSISVLNTESGQKLFLPFPNGLVFDEEFVRFAINDAGINLFNDYGLPPEGDEDNDDTDWDYD